MNEEVPAAPDPEQNPKQTILVVEDEFVVRWSAAHYLRHAGYQVLEAMNSNEAMSLVTSGIKIDLVFSNVNMPGGEDGYFLERWLAKHRPRMPVVLTSGNSREPSQQPNHPDLRRFIRKPYELPSVQQIMQAMLEAAR